MSPIIKVTVKILRDSPTFDEVGLCYDFVIEWVPTVALPVGATNPTGQEFIVEISSGTWEAEEVRDEIRDAAIGILNALPGFAAAALTRGNVQILGTGGAMWTNQGDDDNLTASTPMVLYPGPPMRPNIPTLLNTPREVGEMSTWHHFENGLNDDLKDDTMIPIVYFDSNPTLSKLQYRLLGFDSAGSQVWTQTLSLVGTTVTATVDLSLVGQTVLWTTGDVRFALAIVRTVSGYDIPPDATGIVRQAVIIFQRV